MAMLEVQNLTVNYGYISALTEASFEVREGEIVTLIGSNGAGKTTALMSVSGLVDKAGGTVSFKGQDITRMPAHKIVQLGIAHVPEGRKIFPELTVEENLRMGAFAAKTQNKENYERVYTLFPRLKERLKQAGGTLSGGEQQMLAIGRGLMLDPELLVLDEPSLGLAPIIVEEIFELILRVKRSGMTILLVEQNASMALSIADRGYVLETGRVRLTGSGQELLKNDDVKKAYLGEE